MADISKLTGKPKHTCPNCAVLATCKKPEFWDDSCDFWQDPTVPTAQIWEALQEAITNRDRETLTEMVKKMNHRYLVGEGR